MHENIFKKPTINIKCDSHEKKQTIFKGKRRCLLLALLRPVAPASIVISKYRDYINQLPSMPCRLTLKGNYRGGPIHKSIRHHRKLFRKNREKPFTKSINSR